MPGPYVASGAIIENNYRYPLWRAWDPAGRRVTLLLLNPLRADPTTDDPTIRRCVRFARNWLRHEAACVAVGTT
jgi:hypothetical protein